MSIEQGKPHGIGFSQELVKEHARKSKQEPKHCKWGFWGHRWRCATWSNIGIPHSRERVLKELPRGNSNGGGHNSGGQRLGAARCWKVARPNPHEALAVR